MHAPSYFISHASMQTHLNMSTPAPTHEDLIFTCISELHAYGYSTVKSILDHANWVKGKDLTEKQVRQALRRLLTKDKVQSKKVKTQTLWRLSDSVLEERRAIAAEIMTSETKPFQLAFKKPRSWMLNCNGDIYAKVSDGGDPVAHFEPFPQYAHFYQKP